MEEGKTRRLTCKATKIRLLKERKEKRGKIEEGRKGGERRWVKVGHKEE